MTTPQPVEAKLKIMVDQAGARAVNEFTGEVVAAAKAEDNLAAATARRIAAAQRLSVAEIRQLMNRTGQAGPSAPAGLSPDISRRLRSEIESLRRQEQEQRRDSIVGRVESAVRSGEDREFDRWKNRQVRNDLRAMGLNADGSRMNWFQRQGSLGGFAEQFVGSRAAAYATGSAVAAGGAEALINSERAAGRPFLSDRERTEERVRGIPGIGYVAGKFKDLQRAISGETRAVGQTVESFQQAQIYNQLGSQRATERDDLRRATERPLDVARQFGPNFRQERPAGFDRSTLAGEQAFEKESRLLPIRRQLTQTTKERLAAEQSLGRAAEIEQTRKAELAKIERDLVKASQDREKASGAREKDGAKLTEAQAAQREAELLQQRELKLAEARRAAEATGAERGRVNELKDREGRLRVDFARQEYAVAQDRTAQSQRGAVGLSAAGPGGRALAKVGLDLLRQGVPPEQLGEEMRAAVGAVAPETLRKADEKQGEQFQDEFAKLAPDEPGFRNLGRTREEEKRKREELDSAEDKEAGESRQRAADAATALSQSIQFLIDAMTDAAKAVEKIKADGILGRAFN